MQLPKYIALDLTYPYLPSGPITFVFYRSRKIDADLNEKEKMFGGGKKMKAADRLSNIVANIINCPLLDARGEDEDEGLWKTRVANFFSNEDGQEVAQDAIILRDGGVFPSVTFRPNPNNFLAVNLHGQEVGGRGSAVPLPDLSAARAGSGGGMSEVPADYADRQNEGEGSPGSGEEVRDIPVVP